MTYTASALEARATRALKTLVGCPTGATADALAKLGYDQRVMNYLVQQKLVSSRREHFSNPRGLAVTRYLITDEGHARCRS